MKLRILFDNYFFYIIIYAIISILNYYAFDKKVSIGALVVISFLWLSDLIFKKKKYLLNLKIDSTSLEATYLTIFLKEKTYTKERELISSTNYLNSKALFNKFDLLQIVEKNSGDVINFKILEENTQENIREIIR
ncbi:hypothetical protein GON26_10160 [Flavobacterium sp. GA093]|uniref:Uncharacterized protein n=1 Tax=Flavobacterium hydrocarbonoxydans TaxID=2683249 RepID=A0A6I4NJZ6_9FLAO|nr:hypothetical protein [Flavobacterium hydrocarbonoxydans]MWB94728.1 hypothetical protein [Flavobacterium hydrocarbonoxydans]